MKEMSYRTNIRLVDLEDILPPMFHRLRYKTLSHEFC